MDETVDDGWALALEASGHTVLAAVAMDDGISHLRDGGIDIVVIDAVDGTGNLPDLVAALERLPDAPPFVLLSASPAAPEISAHLGAAAFLARPCTADEMGEVVRRLSRFRGVPLPHPQFDDEPTRPH